MAFYKGLVPLRDVLATIYPAESLARAVAGEAGLPEPLIDFSGSAVECWANILSIAQNGRQVPSVIDVVRNHFPKNEEVIEAGQVFHNTPPPSASTSLESLSDSGSNTHVPQHANGHNVAQASPGGTATVNDNSICTAFYQPGQKVSQQYNIDGNNRTNGA